MFEEDSTWDVLCYREAIFRLQYYGGFNFLKTFYMPGRDMSEWQSHYQACYQA